MDSVDRARRGLLVLPSGWALLREPRSRPSQRANATVLGLGGVGCSIVTRLSERDGYANNCDTRVADRHPTVDRMIESVVADDLTYVRITVLVGGLWVGRVPNWRACAAPHEPRISRLRAVLLLPPCVEGARRERALNQAESILRRLKRVELIDIEHPRFAGPEDEPLLDYYDRVNGHAANMVARLARLQ